MGLSLLGLLGLLIAFASCALSLVCLGVGRFLGRRDPSRGETLAWGGRVAVVVGPEGGLTPDEVDALLACNPRASLVSLGPSILRTETAGVVAPALVLYELGALGGRAGQA